MLKLFAGKWSFFLNGALFAVLFVLCLYALDESVGMTDGYAVMSDYCGDVIRDESIEESPPFNWKTGFLLGIFLGALAAALIDKEWSFELFPDDRGNKKFLPSLGVTPARGVVGGLLVMLGLQLGGDSFLGQWASVIQLSLGGILFVFGAMATGISLNLIRSGWAARGGDGKESKSK